MLMAKLFAATSLIVVAVDASTSIVGLDSNPLLAPASAEAGRVKDFSPAAARHLSVKGDQSVSAQPSR